MANLLTDQSIGELYEAVCRLLNRQFGFDADTCADVASEVFVYALQKKKGLWAELDGESARRVLLRMAKSRGVSEIRRRQRHAKLESDISVVDETRALDMVAGEDGSTIGTLLADELALRRRVAISQSLRDFVRNCESMRLFRRLAIFEMRAVFGTPTRQVAERLNVENAVVSLDFFRAREWVVKRLRDHYDFRGSLFPSRYDDPLGGEEVGEISPPAARHHLIDGGHCDQAVLGQYLDETLDDAQRTHVGQHLKQCTGCHRQFRALQQLDVQWRDELGLAHIARGAMCPDRERLMSLSRESAETDDRRSLLVHALDGECPWCQTYLTTTVGLSAVKSSADAALK